MVNRSGRSASPALTVFSVIALAVSVLALICVLLLLVISKAGTGQGGTATAVSNSVALSVTGMIFFTAFTWIFAISGGMAGFIMLITDIAAKRADIVWMPILAVVLGIVSILLSLLAY
ncbi:MAG: hypothetical protein K6G58_04480 [Lachnospiraceae bacterium]|nr:hypothetical protein [Lachnospiraceae bacterium]